jgi:hypothetical protein
MGIRKKADRQGRERKTPRIAASANPPRNEGQIGPIQARPQQKAGQPRRRKRKAPQSYKMALKTAF